VKLDERLLQVPKRNRARDETFKQELESKTTASPINVHVDR
jgi:hypothetical protein